MAQINPFQGPINYAVDVQSPFEAALSGFKIGQAGAEIRAQTEAREQAAKNQTALRDLFKNPNATAGDYARVTAFLPKDQAAIVQTGFEAQTKEQQQNTLKKGTQVYTAIKSGNLPVAQMRLTEEAKALREAGKEKEAQGFDDLSNLIRMNPTGAQATIALTIAGLPGGKEFLENADKALSTQREEALAPAKLQEALGKATQEEQKALNAVATARDDIAKAEADRQLAQAQADKAKVEADFAKSNAELEQQKKRADITKTKADILISQEDNRIKALNATIARETNVLRRQELQQKIDEATEKRDSTKRDQQATLASVQADVDNFVNTATQVLNTPIEIIRSATGPVASRLPTLSQEVADFEALVETLGSQVFIAQIPKIKGTGSLTEKEGDKLQASLQNLSLKQSPEQLKKNVTEAVRLLEKARTNAAARAGLPSTPRDVPAEGLTVRLPNGATATFPTKAAADAYKKAAGIQ
jgi:hypothetical protein